MEFNLTAKIVLQSVSAILSLSMIIYFVLNGKRTPLIRSYIWCQILIFVWSIGQMFELVATNRETKFFFVVLEYSAISFIGFAWMVFCFLYTDFDEPLKKRNVIYILLAAPILNFLFVLTNEYHHLFYRVFEYDFRQYGPLFWMTFVSVHTYCFIGTGVLVWYALQQLGYAKKRSILLILAMLIPLSTNILYVFRIIDIGIDITPLSFSFSLMFFAVATFKYRFLNIMPIALQNIADNMKESILIVDNSNKVIDLNRAFSDTFNNISEVRDYDDIQHFIKALEARAEPSVETQRILDALRSHPPCSHSGELALVRPEKKCFSVNIQPIITKNKDSIGKVISFNDISQYKSLMTELDEKNIELLTMNGELTFVNEQLMSANEQLKDYAKTAEELAITKERNRFARDIHDTLGHTMTLLISLLQVSSITYRTDPVQTEEKLQEAIKVAREGLKELRRSISGLAPEKLEANNLISAIKNLIEDYRSSGIHIDFSVEGIDYYRSPLYSDAIYRTCQEALTNSLRHGKAESVTIIMKFVDGFVRLFIFDDGIGCKTINKGFGLSGMEERILNLKGTLTYGSDGESGFNIHLELPLKGECKND